MGIRQLEYQITEVEDRIVEAQLSGKIEDIGKIGIEFSKLKFMLNGLSSFVEHRWQVKLFSSDDVVWYVDIRAEHLEEAREKAIDMCDNESETVRYELYCDGILIPEEN